MSQSVSRAAQQRAGLPDHFKPYSAFPFDGVNQSASRIAMKDQQFYWLENFIRIGDGNLRTLWDAGSTLYTAPVGKTIVYFFWFNLGQSVSCAVFLSDGSAVQVAYPSGTQTPIGSVTTFYTAGQTLPICTQSGTQYLLIANHNTNNDYWIWDGSVLYQAGSIAPANSSVLITGGTGYTSVPTYTVHGGSGSGVVLTSVISEGSVVSLTVDNPGSGYLPGDIVQVAFSGGGSDSTPILTATLTGGAIGHITLLSGGTGYTIGTYALSITGGGGTGAAGTYTVTATGGPVVSIQLTNSGSGYTSAPTIGFPSGGGSGASAAPFINGSGVSAITVVSGGTGLTGTPVLVITGGGGTGATATATVSGGAITSVSVNNPGSAYQSAPAVEVQIGLNNAAAAILDIMPFGISGTSLETYQSRVWIGYPNQQGKQNNGGTFLTSAPGSLIDFATSDGGNIFVNSDRFLRQNYVFLRQTSNFLYAAGDSSVSVISNVQTGGSPTATTFSYQNTDPQVGTSWRDTAEDFGNTILFANVLGVYGIYGGSVRKVSTDLDKLFTNAVSPANGGVTPSGAVANVYSQKIYFLLFTITDPFTRTPRTVLLGWDEKRWIVASQSKTMTFIGTQEINSNLQAWGTDGSHLFPLLATPSSTLVKSISTKLYGGMQSYMIKALHSLYIDAEDFSTAQTGITFSGAANGDGLALPVSGVTDPNYYVATELQSVPSTSIPLSPLNMQAPLGLGGMLGVGWGSGLPQLFGIAMGMTLASSSPDFVVRNLTLGFIEPWTGIA